QQPDRGECGLGIWQREVCPDCVVLGRIPAAGVAEEIPDVDWGVRAAGDRFRPVRMEGGAQDAAPMLKTDPLPARRDLDNRETTVIVTDQQASIVGGEAHRIGLSVAASPRD